MQLYSVVGADAGEDDLYDDHELATRRAGGDGGPTELLLKLDDWVQFRVSTRESTLIETLVARGHVLVVQVGRLTWMSQSSASTIEPSRH